VLANFKQVVKDKPVRIHPIVSQLVDPAVLEKMKVRPAEANSRTPRRDTRKLTVDLDKVGNNIPDIW
jgi:cytolysin-activating lysine-acyltransferase